MPEIMRPNKCQFEFTFRVCQLVSDMASSSQTNDPHTIGFKIKGSEVQGELMPYHVMKAGIHHPFPGP